MNPIKRFFKINSHSPVLKPLAGLGRSINRLYENRNHDASSNGELNLLKKFASLNPSVIFDVGANVGEYAMLASSHCAEATIYSFEPVSKTYTMLQANIKDHAREKIIPVNKGFYSENKKQLINIYPGHEHASLHDIIISSKKLIVIDQKIFCGNINISIFKLNYFNTSVLECFFKTGKSIIFCPFQV